MSYLNVPRLHFSGKFQSDVSTINNDPTHFNNATFQPQYEQPLSLTDMNGWWNPRGSGAFRLVGCRVQMVRYLDGTVCTDATRDPVIGMSVSDGGGRVAAKMVDLDSEQQWVSEIWGLIVRLLDGAGAPRVEGKYKVAPFFDIWQRAQGKTGGDQSLAAAYQSVLSDLRWQDDAGSRFLNELREAARESGELSIKWNLDGYNMSSTSPNFTLGRIVGTIGAARPGEPERFVLGRQMMPELTNRVTPANNVYFFPCIVDKERRKVVADLGHALPTTLPGGPLFDLGRLGLGVTQGDGSIVSLGQINYQQPDWYTKTAGVQELPEGRTLSDQEIALLDENPLSLFTIVALPEIRSSQPKSLVDEAVGGVHVRADQFVFRLNPGERAKIEFYATRYGEPLRGEDILCYLDGSRLQPGGPPVAIPVEAISFPEKLTTDEAGRATLTVSARAPNNPRGYIDGQIYAIGYKLVLSDSNVYQYNQGDFISLLLWDEHPMPAEPSWHDVQPIFQQYANLYPVMKPFVDLGDRESVLRNKGMIQMAMGLPMDDPNYMPVTRDLSDGKRRMILAWLATAGDKPEPETAAPPPVKAAPLEGPSNADEFAELGGKMAAMARRNPALVRSLKGKNED